MSPIPNSYTSQTSINEILCLDNMMQINIENRN